MIVTSKRIIAIMVSTLIAAPLVAQPQTAERGVAHPERWPQARSTGLIDPATEAFVTDLMAKLSLEEKVGQMIQGDTSDVTPGDLRQYPLGSILAGGNSPPLGSDDRAQ